MWIVSMASLKKRGNACTQQSRLAARQSARRSKSGNALSAKPLPKPSAPSLQEIQLTAQLAQVKASMARTEQTAPERAAEQARARGAADMRTIEQCFGSSRRIPPSSSGRPRCARNLRPSRLHCLGRPNRRCCKPSTTALKKMSSGRCVSSQGMHIEEKDALDLATAAKYERHPTIPSMTRSHEAPGGP